MNIEPLNEHKLRLHLSQNEIFALFGGYERIDYNDPVARDVLHRLVRQALEREHFPLDTKRLLIEVKPTATGCIVDLIKREAQQKRAKRLYPPDIWRLDFYDTESMISAMCALYTRKKGVGHDGVLYRSEKGYHAILSATSRAIEQILTFAEANRSPAAVAAIREYALPICAKDAVNVLGNSFCR